MHKTMSAKPTEVVRKWYVIDASEAPLGRVSTRIAGLLVGKSKPNYTPHVDGGDFVVVINADKAYFTGLKEEDKTYYRHTGYPGGIKETTPKKLRADGDATKIIEKAVYGMLPVNKLRDGRMKRLKVYRANEHNHAAQKPESLSLKGAK